jgi:hypothetical protein
MQYLQDKIMYTYVNSYRISYTLTIFLQFYIISKHECVVYF